MTWGFRGSLGPSARLGSFRKIPLGSSSSSAPWTHLCPARPPPGRYVSCARCGRLLWGGGLALRRPLQPPSQLHRPHGGHDLPLGSSVDTQLCLVRSLPRGLLPKSFLNNPGEFDLPLRPGGITVTSSCASPSKKLPEISEGSKPGGHSRGYRKDTEGSENVPRA